jgi:hypothetical protein
MPTTKECWNDGMMEDGPCVDCRYVAVDQIVAKKAEKWRMGGQLPGGMMECWNDGKLT